MRPLPLYIPGQNNGDWHVTVLLLMILLFVSSFQSALPVGAQTKGEVEAAERYLKTPQTRSSTCAFWGGYYLGRGEFGRAFEYYRKLAAVYNSESLSLSPKEAWAVANQARCLASLGRAEQARSLANSALDMLARRKDLEESNFHLYFDHCRQICKKVLTGKGSYPDESEVANQPLSVGDWAMECKSGIEALQGGDYADAKVHLTDAVAARPTPCKERSLAMTRLGDAYLYSHEYDKARRLYSKVILEQLRFRRGDPIDAASSFRGLGAVYLRMKDYSKAEESLKKSADMLERLEPNQSSFRSTWLQELINVRRELVKLYEASGRPTAASYQRQLLTQHERENAEILKQLY